MVYVGSLCLTARTAPDKMLTDSSTRGEYMQETFEATVVHILNQWLQGLLTYEEVVHDIINATIEFDIILQGGK